MNTIKVDFQNFWSNFCPKLGHSYVVNFVSHYFALNGFGTIIDSNDPDVIFYSVFGKPNFDNKSVKILFTRENLYSWAYLGNDIEKLANFDCILGFEDNISQNHYKIPYYFYFGKLYDQNLFDYKIVQSNMVETFCQRNKNISLISRNPHQLRFELINKFKAKNINVDCPSSVGKNLLPLKETHQDSKRKFLYEYFFNICPENSWAEGYTTEKLYDAMFCGCIPIYWGCDRLDDGFYNKDKILLINRDLSNIDSIIDNTIQLLNNPNNLTEYSNLPPFGENRIDIIDQQHKKINSAFQKILDLTQ